MHAARRKHRIQFSAKTDHHSKARSAQIDVVLILRDPKASLRGDHLPLSVVCEPQLDVFPTVEIDAQGEMHGELQHPIVLELDTMYDRRLTRLFGNSY